MNQILTWGEFLSAVKNEGNQNENSNDTFLLECANEILCELCSATQNLRDLTFNTTLAIASVTQVTLTNLYVRELDQVWYQQWSAGVFVRRWDLTEIHGKIGPSPIVGMPDSYSADQNSSGTVPQLTLDFNPIDSGVVGDKIQVLGTGFVFITDTTTVMPYLTFYPYLKRSLLQRLQIKRSIKPDMVAVWDGPIQRAGKAALVGTGNAGDSLTNESKNP